jgi:hypothetical protein
MPNRHDSLAYKSQPNYCTPFHLITFSSAAIRQLSWPKQSEKPIQQWLTLEAGIDLWINSARSEARSDGPSVGFGLGRPAKGDANKSGWTVWTCTSVPPDLRHFSIARLSVSAWDGRPRVIPIMEVFPF